MAKKQKTLSKSKTEKKPAAKKAVKKTAKKTPEKSVKAKRGRKGEDLMCFLTTACVRHKGLADDCYELSTLRQYRDGFLLAQPGTSRLVQEYYCIAPEIVKKIDQSPAKQEPYEYIYGRISWACHLIEKREFLAAKDVYVDMVKTLCRKYKVQARFF